MELRVVKSCCMLFNRRSNFEPMSDVAVRGLFCCMFCLDVEGCIITGEDSLERGFLGS